MYEFPRCDIDPEVLNAVGHLPIKGHGDPAPRLRFLNALPPQPSFYIERTVNVFRVEAGYREVGYIVPEFLLHGHE
jgi:hypothetical protein